MYGTREIYCGADGDTPSSKLMSSSFGYKRNLTCFTFFLRYFNFATVSKKYDPVLHYSDEANLLLPAFTSRLVFSKHFCTRTPFGFEK